MRVEDKKKMGGESVNYKRKQLEDGDNFRKLIG